MLSINNRLASFMTEEQVLTFLRSYPEYAKTLDRAIWAEELHKNDSNYFGWEWSDVGTMGSKLVRLVTNDIATINFKSNKRTIYLLSNRDVTKEALEKFRSEQLALSVKKIPENLFKPGKKA
jgi:hypothetical protein